MYKGLISVIMGLIFIPYEIKSNSSGDFISFLMKLNMNFPQHVIYKPLDLSVRTRLLDLGGP